jgi:hypothetical protein
MNNQPKSIFSGWTEPEDCDLYESDIEELYGYSAEELTGERFASLEAALTWPEFVNPLDTDSHAINATYYPDNLGEMLFAPGLIHWIYGPSETGKSFIGLTACLQNSGIYVSLEMGVRQMGQRVRKMGYHYLDSNRFLFVEQATDLRQMIIAMKLMSPTVIVFDSFGELALLFGADTNNDQDVGRIIREVLKPLTGQGHCVVVIDHIAKNPGNIEYPLGTQNKKSQSDICIYVSRDVTSGLLEMIITKDRYYIYEGRFTSLDRKYGTIEITDAPTRAKVHRLGHEEFMPISMSTPVDRRTQDAIIKLLNESGPIQKSHIKYKVEGSDKKIDKALDQLSSGGWVSITKGRNAEGYTCRIVALTGKPWTPAPRLYGN